MVGRGSSAIRRPYESSQGDRFPSQPWSHLPVIGGVASPPAADAEGKTAGLVAIPGNGPPVAQRAAGRLAPSPTTTSTNPLPCGVEVASAVAL